MTKNIISAILILGFIIGVSIFARISFNKNPHESKASSVEKESETIDHPLTGEELARKHCIECHEFTEPNLLSKKSWNFLLTYMGLRLGIEDFSYVKNPTQQETGVLNARKALMAAEDLFLETPAMSDEEWKQLRDYYIDNAPEDVSEQIGKPASSGLATLFKEKQHLYNVRGAITSMVHINEENGQILIGDSRNQKLTILDKNLNLFDSISSKNMFWVDVEMKEDAVYMVSVGDIPGNAPGLRLGKIAYGKRRGERFYPQGYALMDLYRPTDIEFADLNNDGVEEMLVCNFGDEGGDFSIYAPKPNSVEFKPEPITSLFENTGPIQCEVHDFNNDGLLDIVLLVSDVEEQLALYINKGDFKFSKRFIVNTHPAWGYMSFRLADINGDGLMDIVTGNGDNGDSDPYNTLKPYHGIRIYLNQSELGSTSTPQFEESYFYPMYGCYQVYVHDFDLDGDLDIVANSFHPDFASDSAETFVYLEQNGDGNNMQFAPKHHDAPLQGRWMVMNTGDIDQDGDVDIVFGGAYVPVGLPEPDSPIFHKWMKGKALLVLENQTR